MHRYQGLAIKWLLAGFIAIYMYAHGFRYNPRMVFKYIASSFARNILSLLGGAISSIDNEADHEHDDRSLLDGSRFSGDLNFRTGQMDCGTDLSSWYEDDF